jgi:putative phosphonate metabolism protein
MSLLERRDAMRAAIYYTPPADHPLTRAAAAWLGRDAFTGEPISERISEAVDADAITAEPRRYGFHATMKAPFRLARDRSLADLDRALAQFCGSAAPTGAITLRIERLGSFFALTPRLSNPAVAALAASVVRNFEPFRAPLEPHELARRKAAGLSGVHERNLVEWGYPYVFDEFRFHMTLTGPIAPEQREAVLAVLERRFGALIADPIEIDTLALFVQSESDTDFLVHARHPLQGGRSAYA